MTIEVIKIKDWLRSGQRQANLKEQYTFPDLPMKGPVDVSLRIQLTATGLTVSGKFQACIEEPCDRCTEAFERKIEEVFEERFVYEALIDNTPSGDMQLQSDDFYDVIGPDGILDIKDLIHQYIVIGVSNDRVCEKTTCSLS